MERSTGLSRVNPLNLDWALWFAPSVSRTRKVDQSVHRFLHLDERLVVGSVADLAGLSVSEEVQVLAERAHL
jgi:hypothetical protein